MNLAIVYLLFFSSCIKNMIYCSDLYKSPESIKDGQSQYWSDEVVQKRAFVMSNLRVRTQNTIYKNCCLDATRTFFEIIKHTPEILEFCSKNLAVNGKFQRIITLILNKTPDDENYIYYLQEYCEMNSEIFEKINFTKSVNFIKLFEVHFRIFNKAYHFLISEDKQLRGLFSHYFISEGFFPRSGIALDKDRIPSMMYDSNVATVFSNSSLLFKYCEIVKLSENNFTKKISNSLKFTVSYYSQYMVIDIENTVDFIIENIFGENNCLNDVVFYENTYKIVGIIQDDKHYEFIKIDDDKITNAKDKSLFTLKDYLQNMQKTKKNVNLILLLQKYENPNDDWRYILFKFVQNLRINFFN